jgi:hypothetical protein
MADPPEAQEIDLNAVSNFDGYTSMMLQLYIETMVGKDQELRVSKNKQMIGFRFLII